VKKGEFITIAFHKVNMFLNLEGVSFFFSHPFGYELPQSNGIDTIKM